VGDLTSFLWIVFGITTIAATIMGLRLRHELQQSGWWTGIVVEGRKVEVGVDIDLCMGASSCTALAPEVFRLDWSKRKSMFDPAPLEHVGDSSADPEKIFKAAQSCPYRAIFLRDAATGERIFP
jgi:ferredoxin